MTAAPEPRADAPVHTGPDAGVAPALRTPEKAAAGVDYDVCGVMAPKDYDALLLASFGGPEGQERPVFNPLVQCLVAAGLTVFAPNVRGSGGFGRAFMTADDGAAREAVRRLRAEGRHASPEGSQRDRVDRSFGHSCAPGTAEPRIDRPWITVRTDTRLEARTFRVRQELRMTRNSRYSLSIPDLTGRRAVVTGASDGIGWEIANALAGAGAEVVVPVRDPNKGARAVERIRDRHPAATLTMEDVDLWAVWDAIHCPVLVLRGADSDLLTRDTAREMTRRGPKAELVEFPGCGHAPALNVPDQLNAVETFIRAAG